MPILDDITDRRLQPVLDAIAARQIKVLSVDVFDTLLWRKVPEAQDAFWLLGNDLKQKGHLAAHVSPGQFAELRPAAERKVRSIKELASGSREITLEDVYALLPDSLFATDFDIARRCQHETAFECGLMVGDVEVAALLNAARAAGVKTMLVSDTYFSGEDLRRFIKAAFGGVPPLFDRLVVSNEEGRPKWRDLFDHLIPTLNALPQDIMHIGDNYDADVMPCRRLGMQSVFYDKWVFSPRVQQHEFPPEASARRALLGPHGDDGLTGLRSRLYHRVPAEVPETLHPFWRYGACVHAPVFAAFAHWMVDECQRNNFPKIFGLMREGRFLNRLVDAAAASAGVKVVTEELWLSRRAVVRAALYPHDLVQLSSFISYASGETTDEILAECGLSGADLAGLNTHGVPFNLLDGDDLMRLCAYIEKSESLKAKVCAASAALRKNLILALWKQVDLHGSTPFVMMDLGYAATIQVVLERILRREGFKVPVVGLYLALNEAAAQNVLGSIDISGIDVRAYLSHEGYDPKAARILTAMPYVFEHACMCREGTLYRFDAAGAPVLLENQRENAQLVQMEVLQDGIMAGVAAIDKAFGAAFRLSSVNTEYARRQVESIVVTSTLYPAREEVATLGRWRHEAKYVTKNQRRFIDMAVDAGKLEHKGLAMLNEFTGQQSYWTPAGLSFISPFMADAYAAGFFSAYKATHLTSGSLLGQFAICPDRGAGFLDHEQGATAITINAFGAGEVDVTLDPRAGNPFQRLRFRWPQANAVLKLVSLDVTYQGQGQSKMYEMLEPQYESAWAFSGVRQIEPQTMLLSAEGPQAILSIGALTPPWPHTVRLQLRYKYLKLDSLFVNRSAS